MTKEKAIETLENFNSWNYCGKVKKANGLTYYEFVDADYVPQYIYCKVLKEYAERLLSCN